MPAVWNLHHLCPFDFGAKDFSVTLRDKPILLTPYDERRRGYSRKPAFQTALRNREQKLRRGSEAPRHREQHLDLFIAAIVAIAKELSHREQALCRETILIVKEKRRQLGDRHS